MDDKVFVKVAPYKNVMRFDRRRKLALRYVGLFRILKCVGKLVYKLALPTSMDYVHNVFHM